MDLYASWQDEYVHNPLISPKDLAAKWGIKVRTVWRTSQADGLVAQREAWKHQCQTAANERMLVELTEQRIEALGTVKYWVTQIKRASQDPTLKAADVKSYVQALDLVLKWSAGEPVPAPVDVNLPR